ncbi:ABC transporter ATP-binding protein [Cryptosporangium minutisporangium]|uniref:ABC transporter ATP-binding protein n=1 Tax=Cryptosporangium minutisporangium TaxID=113569 RepID=A0ABP6TCD5_9ACTN
MTTLVQTSGLERSYGAGESLVRAVDGIDLAVGEGEFVSVMGPSGCGKSTLLYLLAGLLPPSRGQITLGGQRVERLSRSAWARLRRRRIGFVFQSYNLVDNLTVLENLQLPGMLGGRSGRAARRRALTLLDELGVADKARATPGVLSGGQRQRVAVARALMNEPELLLADEPTGNLDSAATTEVLGLLRQSHRDGQAIVLVTHDPRVATAAQRLVTMRDGQVVDETMLTAGTGQKLHLSDVVDNS